MATTIRNFWLSNPEYWIAIGEHRSKIDLLIYDQFRKYDYSEEDNLGKVIYLDQFTRHFSRIEEISEEEMLRNRKSAIEIVKTVSMEDLQSISDKELIWFLMPWKHLCEWNKIFQVVHTWLSSRPITDFPYLNRFFMDTYKKAYTNDAIAKKIVVSSLPQAYDRSICEAHPEKYDSTDWQPLPIPEQAKPLLSALTTVCNEPITISLSGGVDSMLMARLLAKTNTDVIAVHIVYGNRTESIEEEKFVSTYCHKLGIPLYIYTIEWLKRSDVDRAFYERITRDIRFHVYKILNRPVLLGHIQEDVVENIWTNIAKGTNLDNLAKLQKICTEEGVRLYRPWLTIKKECIFAVADALATPYLKNTTPSWSNRGKFRETFHKATKEQYGTAIDEKMLEVADHYAKQSDLLDRLLFQPIQNSWDKDTKQINVTQAILMQLDGHSWQRILKDLAHKHIGTGMPSVSACDDFAKRIRKGMNHGQKIRLSKKFQIQVCIQDGNTLLKLDDNEAK